VIAVLVTFALVLVTGTTVLFVVNRWDPGYQPAPRQLDDRLTGGDTVDDRYALLDSHLLKIRRTSLFRSCEKAHGVSDVLLVVLAFLLVAATVVWACSRITADAADESGSEMAASDRNPADVSDVSIDGPP
jgi:hypothetical protein